MARLHLIYELIRLERLPLGQHEQYQSYGRALLSLAQRWSEADAMPLSPRSGAAIEGLLGRAHQLGLEAEVQRFRDRAPYFNTAREVIHRLETREGLVGVGILAVSGIAGGIAAGIAEGVGWARNAIAVSRFAGMYAMQNTLELGGSSMARVYEGRQALRPGQVGRHLLQNGVALVGGEFFAAPFAGNSLGHFLMFNHGMVMGPELAARTPGLSDYLQRDSRPYFAQYLGASVDSGLLMGMARPAHAAMAGSLRALTDALVQSGELPPDGGGGHRLPSPAVGAMGAGLATFLRPGLAHAGILEGVQEVLASPTSYWVIGLILSYYLGGRLRRGFERREAEAIRALDGGTREAMDPFRSSMRLGELWQRVSQASSAEELRNSFAEYRASLRAIQDPQQLRHEFRRLHHFLKAQKASRMPAHLLAYAAFVEVFQRLPRDSSAYQACLWDFYRYPHFWAIHHLAGINPLLNIRWYANHLKALLSSKPNLKGLRAWELGTVEQALAAAMPILSVAVLFERAGGLLGPYGAWWGMMIGQYIGALAQGWVLNGGKTVESIARGESTLFRRDNQSREEWNAQMRLARQIAAEIFDVPPEQAPEAQEPEALEEPTQEEFPEIRVRIEADLSPAEAPERREETEELEREAPIPLRRRARRP